MNLFLAQLRVKLKELIGRRQSAIFLERHLDNAQPELSLRLVIAARRGIQNMIGGIVSANSIAELDPRNFEPVALKVKISQLDVGAVMPLIEWQGAGFELFDEFGVVHGQSLCYGLPELK